jgi:hypothetical protein
LTKKYFPGDSSLKNIRLFSDSRAWIQKVSLLRANDATMAEVQADYYEEMFKEITKKFYYGDDEDLEVNHKMEEKARELLGDDDFKMVVVKEDEENSLLEEFNNEESNKRDKSEMKRDSK